jgi:hypothetical protein
MTGRHSQKRPMRLAQFRTRVRNSRVAQLHCESNCCIDTAAEMMNPIVGEPDDAEVEAFLRLLPKLAFFLPTIPPHEVDVEGVTYNVREHVIGLLWLIDELTIDGTCCQLKELRRIFNHWWPAESKASEKSNLSHYLDELLENGLVD